MRRKRLLRRFFAMVLVTCLITGVLSPVTQVMADGALVLTLGADLTEEQKQGILDFFNVKEADALVITVTNADERKLLEGQYTEAQIGTKTFSCALVNPTASGGIQVKTANMNVVTSGRIASILSTSGITDCEVLTAAPFMVSGTGALTGVMMGYEEALGVTLDPEKQQMAIEESTTVSQIGETMGQNEATLVVNDIKIRVVRDQAKEPEEIRNAVNTTVDQVEEQLAQLAQTTGNAAPEKLGSEDREVLYDYGEKISKMDYDYNSMKLTLQRVTVNAAREIGIDDPITDTFEDLSAEDVLPENSILLGTNDESMGEDANITATDTSTLEDAPTLDEAVATAELRGSLYALFDIPLTWTEARRYCRDLKGDLVSISTLEEQAFVEQLAAKSSKDFSWLGGEYDSQNDRWWWSNGSSFKFSNWDDTQPDGTDDGEFFMQMANRDIHFDDWTAHAGKWNDARENGDEIIPLEVFGFICEIEQERGQADKVEEEDSYAVDPKAHITDVRLTPVSSVENANYIFSGTSLISVQSDQGDGFASIDGTLLTDRWYDSIYTPTCGLLKAVDDQSNLSSEGVIAQNGKLVVPCTYFDINVLNPHWVLAINVADGSEADYDYKVSSSKGDKYCVISTVDVYYVNDGEGSLIGSLAREDYSYAEAVENYINIENRNGVRTSYDSDFQVVANDVSYGFDHLIPKEYSSYYDYESQPSAGVQDANGNIVLAPFADYVYEIADGCVYYSMKQGDGELYGLKRLDGTDVLPAEFDKIKENASYISSPVDQDMEPLVLWNHGGYYLVVHNGTYGFAVDGGTITCETDISENDTDADRSEVCIGRTDDDGVVTLYAADGQITSLEGNYSYISSLNGSMGMLWDGYNGDSHEVFDWHGNKLLSDLYDRSTVSGDGMYLATRKNYDAPLEIYAVTYIYDNGQEISPLEASIPESEPVEPDPADPESEPAEPETVDLESEPAELDTTDLASEPVQPETTDPESEPTEPETTTTSSLENIISVLENTVTTIQNTDLEAKREQIVQILDMEVDLLASDYTEASAILGSVADLVRSGSGDANSIVTLIQSAINKLKG